MSYPTQQNLQEFIAKLDQLGFNTDDINERVDEVSQNVQKVQASPIVSSLLSNYSGDFKANFQNTVQWYISDFFNRPFAYVKTPQGFNMNGQVTYSSSDVIGNQNYLTIINENIALPAGGYIISIFAIGTIIEPIDVSISTVTNGFLMSDHLTSGYTLNTSGGNVYTIRTFIFNENTDLVVSSVTTGVYTDTAFVVAIRPMSIYSASAYALSMAKIQGR